ncbi:MAG: hypothetical protein NC417_12230 [Candidatus Gastranaerophilales bacterium]|nr:hypothetical protein [Candidatus Gastranaerophilales bacterium]
MYRLLEKLRLHKPQPFAACTVAMAFYLFRALEKAGIQAQHEAFKKTIKAFIMNNNNLNFYQKQQAVNSIDAITQEADLLVEMLRMCGFIQ